MGSVYNLPDILDSNWNSAEGDIFFYHHIGKDSHNRVRISFNTHCITLLLSGKKKVIHGQSSVFYDNSNCLLFKSGNYLSTEISAGKTPYHSLLIFFSISALEKFKHKYYNIIAESAEKRHTNYISLDTDFFIDSYKGATVSLLDKGGFTPEMQRIKFEELMLYLLEREGSHILHHFSLQMNQDRYHFFRSVVESHTKSNLLVEELAFLCHMSVSTFKRTFMEIYGMNPGKWLRVKRLEHAAYLIRAKKKRPSEVYDDVGFSSLSSFIFSFRQQFGITPKQFQRSKVDVFSTL